MIVVAVFGECRLMAPSVDFRGHFEFCYWG